MEVLIPSEIAQQSDYIVLQISQSDIKDCNTSEYVTLLHGATGSLQSFEGAFQKYVLLISGYDDDDTRELYQIPEVVKFIKDLNSKLPFWLYFVNTSDKRFFSWMIAKFEFSQTNKIKPCENQRRILRDFHNKE